MEKVEEREVKLKYHKFYCDECGKYLGEDYEDENGHYRTPYMLPRIRVTQGTPFAESSSFILPGTFCNACKLQKYNWIKENLINLGFEEEREDD